MLSPAATDGAAAKAKALSDDAIKMLRPCTDKLQQLERDQRPGTHCTPPRSEHFPFSNGSKDNFGYRRLLETMALYQAGEASMILPEMWGQTVRLNHDSSDVVNASGNVTLFAFNFTPDGRPDAPTFHPHQSGNVRLQFKLNVSAGHAITVLIYAEFEIVMEIDNNNGVLYNDDS